MTFWCVVSSSCLTVPLSNFLCNGPHIVIPTSQNCSHTKFSRKLLLSFFLNLQLYVNYVLFKSPLRGSESVHGMGSNQALQGELHTAAPASPCRDSSSTSLFLMAKLQQSICQHFTLTFPRCKQQRIGPSITSSFYKASANRATFCPLFHPETTSLPQVHSSVTEHNTWQKAQNLTQQVYGVWR